MQCFILSTLFGAICAVIILAGADSVDWTRFKFWVGEMWEKIKRKIKGGI